MLPVVGSTTNGSTSFAWQHWLGLGAGGKQRDNQPRNWKPTGLQWGWLAVVGWLDQQRVVVALAWCGGSTGLGLVGLVLDDNNVTINRGIGHPLACSGAGQLAVVGWFNNEW